MAQPAPYSRAYDFSTALVPVNAPEAGSRNNTEFDRLATFTSQARASLAQIQRDDGALANGIVTLDSMTATVRALMGGWTPRGTWVTATGYAVRDLIADATDGEPYICAVAHTAGTFATDLAAGKWIRLYGTGVLNATASVLVPGSSTARTLGDRFGESANVLDYGADPTGVANSSAAFVAAAGTGKHILVPGGSYLFTAGFTMSTTNQCLVCDGAVGITLNGAFTFVTLSGGVSGMRVGGFGLTATAHAGDVVRVTNAYRCTVEDIVAAGPDTFAYSEQVNKLLYRNLWVNAVRGTYIFKAYGSPALRSDLIVFDDVTASASSAVTYASRATGLIWDGNVHTICTQGLRFVVPSRGIITLNTAGGSSPSQTPAFLQGDDIEVDYPYYEAFRAEAGGKFYFVNAYLANSVTDVNVFIADGVYQGSFANCFIANAAKENLVVAGDDFVFATCHFSFPSLSSLYAYDAVRCAGTAERISFVGCKGGLREGIGATGRYTLRADAGATKITWSGGDMGGGILGPWSDASGMSNDNFEVTGASGSGISVVDNVVMGTSAGIGAELTPTFGGGGSISSVAVATGGRYYDTAPAVFAADPTGAGTGFTATATVLNGVVSSVAVNTAGSGYAAGTVIGVTAASASPSLRPYGTSTDIALYARAKGAGATVLANDRGIGFVVTPTAAAVNYLATNAAAASGSPTLFAAGTDTNITLGYTAKGTGSHIFSSGSGTALVVAGNVASAVNYVQVTPAVSAGRVRVGAAGADTNVDLILEGKGSGNVCFGTHTGGGDTTSNGYITVRDAAGNLRKLMTTA